MDSARQASPASRITSHLDNHDHSSDAEVGGAPSVPRASTPDVSRSPAGELPSAFASFRSTEPAGSGSSCRASAPASEAMESGGQNPGSQNSGSQNLGHQSRGAGTDQGSAQLDRLRGLPVPDASLPIATRAKAVLSTAADAFAQTGSWVVFYSSMLGVNGVVRRTFRSESEQSQFQATPQFAELLEMVAALRSQDSTRGDAVEPEKMITIRLPESLHAVLAAEADMMQLSINKLCISKLIQPVEGRFVPIQQGRRRGRKPGPQAKRKKTTESAS